MRFPESHSSSASTCRAWVAPAVMKMLPGIAAMPRLRYSQAAISSCRTGKGRIAYESDAIALFAELGSEGE